MEIMYCIKNTTYTRKNSKLIIRQLKVKLPKRQFYL